MSWSRRKFVRNGATAAGGLALGYSALRELIYERSGGRISLGFRNDAPFTLEPNARVGMHWRKDGDLVVCDLCPHHCMLGENDRGYCRSRVVKEGALYTLDYANPCTIRVDPIEKKPLFHYKPNTGIVSLAMAGCNLRCLNCQNWRISQAKPDEIRSTPLTPQQLGQLALAQRTSSIAYTYTEPIIYYEYVYDAASLTRDLGISNVLVTAGYIEKEPLRQLCAVTDAVTLDLKAFTEEKFAKLTTGRLAPVLDGILTMKRSGVWVELSTLVVPEYADDVDEIAAMSRWIVREMGPDVPLHLLRFHPDFKLTNLPRTPVETLLAAREAALAEGMHYVYLGNVPGHETEDTFCPGCGRKAISRTGYHIQYIDIDDGRCPACDHEIAGVWS